MNYVVVEMNAYTLGSVYGPMDRDDAFNLAMAYNHENYTGSTYQVKELRKP